MVGNGADQGGVPTMVKVNFPGPKGAAPPPTLYPDNVLVKKIQQKVHNSGIDPRRLFTELCNIQTEGMRRRPTSSRQRLTVDQLSNKLDYWGFPHTKEQLARVLASYETAPGEGVNYMSFTEFLDGSGDEERQSARVLNEYLMTRAVESVQRGGPLTSSILQPTEQALPRNHNATRFGDPLYGSACGIDVNDDGRNNGFF
eukprot:TRINITY_DN78688_c0_g1_i1.p1 TRINITY_DN78688_c0_g1~~TRINITY_DN78688_c0_g1_i1.p1  ORF type:complete len:200 (+),score=23.75 TRINITY_DN78688_c0_g1_i1:65-664(+)